MIQGSRSLVVCMAIGLLCPSQASADVVVEHAREQPFRYGLHLTLDFKLAFRQGNINLIDAGLRSRLSYQRRRHFVLLLADSRFAAQANARDRGTVRQLDNRDARYLNRHMAHMRYNYRIVKSWLIGELFTQIEMDEFVLLRTRGLLGAGPRFVLHENADFGAYLGTSYMPEYEEFDERWFVSQPTSSRRINVWHRWNNYVSLVFHMRPRVILRSTTYVQPRFDAPWDFRVLTEAQAEIKIDERFSFKLLLGIRHDRLPPRYCVDEIPSGDTCAAENVIELRPTDTVIENALSAKF